MTVAPELTKTIDLTGRRRFLDVGGGPGTYAIYFCLNNPQLHGTIYDLPTTRPFAEKTVAKFGLTGRVDFMDGDYLAEDIAGAYDVAWLSQILHGENPEACQMIVDKTVAALEPGGLIMVHEFILNNTMDGPLFPALFSLNMLLGTDGGQAYSEAQLMEMLGNAGVGRSAAFVSGGQTTPESSWASSSVRLAGMQTGRSRKEPAGRARSAPAGFGQAGLRAGTNPAPWVSDQHLYFCIHTELGMKLLEEPGHVLAEDSHGLQSFLVLFNRSDVTTNAHVPIDGGGTIIWLMKKR